MSQNHEKMSTVELQIAERAKKYKGEALHNLHHYVDEALLQESYEKLNKKSAAGVDGKTWQQYGLEFPERRESLLGEFKSGRYRAPAIRRVYIPKDKHSQRPLGLVTIEDKVLQASVRKVIEPIYEEDFKPFSYGFRPGRSPHQAIDYMFKEVSFGKKHYIIDADIQNYFGCINHGMLRDFLDNRVKDGVIRKMIDKWLKAGVMESGNVSPYFANLSGRTFITLSASDLFVKPRILSSAYLTIKLLPFNNGWICSENHSSNT